MTLNPVRTYLRIINANSVSRSIIHHCITCRSLCGRIGQQKMTELSFDRLQEEHSFTYFVADLFDSFMIKFK